MDPVLFRVNEESFRPSPLVAQPLRIADSQRGCHVELDGQCRFFQRRLSSRCTRELLLLKNNVVSDPHRQSVSQPASRKRSLPTTFSGKHPKTCYTPRTPVVLDGITTTKQSYVSFEPTKTTQQQQQHDD
jgi:hypothetical protein